MFIPITSAGRQGAACLWLFPMFSPEPIHFGSLFDDDILPFYENPSVSLDRRIATASIFWKTTITDIYNAVQKLYFSDYE
jgi:hypothetical protein